MSATTKCHVCGSSKHFLCMPGHKIRFHVTDDFLRLHPNELRNKDLVCVIAFAGSPIHPDSTTYGDPLRSPLARAIRDFHGTKGDSLLIDTTPPGSQEQRARILLMAVDGNPAELVEGEHVSPVLRDLCAAFGKAALEAAKLNCSRLLVDLGDLPLLVGPCVASVLHCRLEVMAEQCQTGDIQQVSVFSRSLVQSLTESCQAQGQLCNFCPFSR